MPLARPRYLATVADPNAPEGYVVHTVEVAYADQLRAELEANKQGLPALAQETGQNHTAVAVWCSLTRQGLYAKDCRTFRLGDLLDLAKPDEEGEEVVVDPTQPAEPTPGASPSQPATAAVLPSGWTPPSTSA